MDTDQQALARWAADCAARVLPYFERQQPDDARPLQAIEAARAWARGELTVRRARAAALAAHTAARASSDPAAQAAARAAGHAAATAHAATHARHAAAYALFATADPAAERAWQEQRLPERLWPLAFPARTAD